MSPRKQEGEAVTQTTLDAIKQSCLIQPGSKLVVGVSGGADSVCLIHILSGLSEVLKAELHIAHLNHGLRGAESDADEKYVRSLAQSLGLPVTVGNRDVAEYRKRKRLGTEEAARDLRYAFFAEVAEIFGTRQVAVGHTRNDHVETVLLHLIRGAGLNGLKGLQPRSVIRTNSGALEVVRPLLAITREETASYCRQRRLAPREDSSNLSMDSLRNRIRLELLPLLMRYNANIDEAVCRLSQIARDQMVLLETQAELLWPKVASTEKGVVSLNRKALEALPTAWQKEMVRMAIVQLLGDLTNVESTSIETAASMIAKPAGKEMHLPRGLVLTCGYRELTLKSGCGSECFLPPFETASLTVPGETTAGNWRIKASIKPRAAFVDSDNSLTAYFDSDRVARELTVRARKAGDRFQPLGMKEDKKLQDFMVDARIPRAWRDSVPLVCSGVEIIWVVGWRISEKVRVTAGTRKVVKIEFEQFS